MPRTTDERRIAALVLAAAMAVAAAVILWLGRGTIFWGDELAWLIESPQLDFTGAIQPHEGHLVLTTRVVYKLFFELFGTAYLPFRLLTLGTVILTVGLFFVYTSRRVGAFVALAPSLVLLLFGSDSLHVLLGNGFTVLLAVACGIGALLAFEDGSRRGDAVACALLCLGVVTYSVALAFVVGAAVAVLLCDDRRRIWLVVFPLAIYASWWLWSLGLATSGEDQASLVQGLLLPAWAFQSLGSVLGALSGFSYRFSDSVSPASLGAPLAALALVGLGLRLGRRPIPQTLWATLAVALTLWLLGALVSNADWRRPDDPRYLFPGAIVVLLVAAEATAGVRWSRAGIYGLYAVALGGLAVNAIQLRDQATEMREITAVQTRAAFTGLELAGRRAQTDFYPRPLDGVTLPLVGEQSPLAVPFSALPAGRSVSTGYVAVTERYGGLGFSVAELRMHGEPAGAQVDAMLVGALDLKLSPPAPVVTGISCKKVGSPGGSGITVRLPRGGALLKTAGPAAEVQVRRFGITTFSVGTLEPGRGAVLWIPPDRARAPWWVYTSGPMLTVCALRRS